MDKLIEITYNLWVIIKLLGVSTVFIIMLFALVSTVYALLIAPFFDKE